MGYERTLRRAATAVLIIWPLSARADTIDWARVSDEAVERLRAYVRVDTTNPPGHETPAAELLRGHVVNLFARSCTFVARVQNPAEFFDGESNRERGPNQSYSRARLRRIDPVAVGRAWRLW